VSGVDDFVSGGKARRQNWAGMEERGRLNRGGKSTSVQDVCKKKKKRGKGALVAGKKGDESQRPPGRKKKDFRGKGGGGGKRGGSKDMGATLANNIACWKNATLYRGLERKVPCLMKRGGENCREREYDTFQGGGGGIPG